MPFKNHSTDLRKLVVLLLFIACLHKDALTQDNTITANQIIQRAIDSSGGDSKLASLHSVEFITQIITPENQVLSLAIKKKDFNKYYISTLSTSHVNSTTIYNNGNAVILKNDSSKSITDPLTLEDLQLQCFISIDYGYKKLGYKLTRLDDEKFQNFDCYTVLAESPLGNKTANYYDKKTGRLTMIIYPNEHKSVFIDFYKSEGLTAPSKVLMTDTRNTVTQSSLQKLVYDNNLDPYWFTLAKEGKYQAPETFKTGVFKYVNSNDGAGFTREKDKHIETSSGQRTEYKIKWDGNSDYLLFRLRNPAKPATDDNIEYFKVKIISWNNTKYYCQYITSDNMGGTCAFEKVK
jgi:hypothetical protein